MYNDIYVSICWNNCRADVLFDRQRAIKLSGMSEKAYIRSFNAMQNGIGVKLVHILFTFAH